MSRSSPRAHGKTALVLSGGGSRGAYEVGVISYLREELPRRLGWMPHFDIICGTSVGAINAAFMAATAEEPLHQGYRLAERWRTLTLEQMYRLDMGDLMHAARLMLGGRPPPAQPGELHRGGLLNTSGLERMVLRTVPWRRIPANMQAGYFEALSVSATHVPTGNTAVFVERAEGGLPPWSHNPLVRARTANIGPFHVLASAAIPVLFPAVKLDGVFYCDGGLRQNTPLSPAVRLGADRVLVISLRHLRTPGEAAAAESDATDVYPSAWFLLGKALNALLLDHTEDDIDRLRRLNALVEAGVSAFGDRFLTEMHRVRGRPLRVVRPLLIRPSGDIGRIAAAYARSPRLRAVPGLLGRALRYVSDAEQRNEADLISYLLFDGQYCAELIEMGRRDARARENELVAFFEDKAQLQAVGQG